VRVDVLNGVNLDILGKRDPALYGAGTLDELETQIYTWGRELGLQVRCRQTNHEGEFVEFCHAALGNADGVVVNPGSWTHYGVVDSRRAGAVRRPGRRGAHLGRQRA